ncbi:MAG: bifunctional hydroxymethylpyrimidine kinase/phosphomethylpyrimidine kinase [Kiritimatiellae bacterium]|nr:bifunctional hydroxymethylpyrimidine kinase/phosphomethylpyrimidine kinase [Kiritimatiellia bacterium]
MIAASKIPVVMTVAGSDSGGGAGVQADLKVFSALKVFGTTAITCITAQNPHKVAGIVSLDPEMIALQIKTVCSAFPVKAAKTGMLYSAGIIRTVAKELAKQKLKVLVVDPVMMATSGGCLICKQAFHALSSELIPMATLITPNIPEAEQLIGKRIGCLDDMKYASLTLNKKFRTACVLKGGHLVHKSGKNRDKVVDVLCVNGDVTEFRVNRVPVNMTHGTGCRFSAALTAYLARKLSLTDAVCKAQRFVSETLSNPLYLGK